MNDFPKARESIFLKPLYIILITYITIVPFYYLPYFLPLVYVSSESSGFGKYWANIYLALTAVIWPYTVLSITITGARAQAPKQATRSKLNL